MTGDKACKERPVTARVEAQTKPQQCPQGTNESDTCTPRGAERVNRIDGGTLEVVATTAKRESLTYPGIYANKFRL